jgi:hypothetical protein
MSFLSTVSNDDFQPSFPNTASVEYFDSKFTLLPRHNNQSVEPDLCGLRQQAATELHRKTLIYFEEIMSRASSTSFASRSVTA